MRMEWNIIAGLVFSHAAVFGLGWYLGVKSIIHKLSVLGLFQAR